MIFKIKIDYMSKEVFKLGGAFFSAEIIRKFMTFFKNETERLYVVSAVKGVTRLLDIIVKIIIQKDISRNFKEKLINLSLEEFWDIHENLIVDLFDKERAKDLIKYFNIEVFSPLRDTIFEKNEDENQYYASVLKYGEIASSKIMSKYLSFSGEENVWLDARDYVLTDANYREAKFVSVHSSFKTCFEQSKTIVTQGFIGRSITGKDTLLGYDGSDFSASVFAIALSEIDEITLSFFKDVNGVYNGNPKKNINLRMFNELRHREYLLVFQETGSFVVRPDSIEALAKARVRTIIRSYLNLDNPGTLILP